MSPGTAPTLLMRLPSTTMVSLRTAALPDPSIRVPLRISNVFFAVAVMMSSGLVEVHSPRDALSISRPERDDLSSNRHPALHYWWSMTPRLRGGRPFPKTGVHPRLRKGMLFGIMLVMML